MIRWATLEWAAAAAATRDDWDQGDTQGALSALQAAHPDRPGLVLLELARHLADPQLLPHDLRARARHPVKDQGTTRPAAPEVRDRAIQAMRGHVAAAASAFRARAAHGGGPQ